MKGSKLSTELWIRLAWPTRLTPPVQRSSNSLQQRRRYTTSFANLSPSSKSFIPAEEEVKLEETLATIEANIFESYTPEYEQVPLSTLDFPAAPRSAASSLLQLLSSQHFDEADSLLKDLVATDQVIEPQIEFAQHAEELLSKDRESNWLDWWTLAPSIDYIRSKSTDLGMSGDVFLAANERVGRMINVLFEESGDFERMLKFGVIATRQGCTRVVAQSLLMHLAAVAPLEVGEELWSTCVEETLGRTIIIPLATSPSDRAAVNSEEGQDRIKRYRALAEGVIEQQFSRAQAELKTYLKAKRGQMLRIHAALGRVEESTTLLLSSPRLSIDGSPVNRITYLHLLDATAKSDRFDLFQQIYQLMQHHRGRLLRLRHSTHTTQFPFFARSTTSQLESDQQFSDMDAFVAFRYAGFASPLEEASYVIEYKSDAVLRTAIAANDLTSAFKELRHCISSGITPSLDAATNAVALARVQGKEELVVSLMERLRRAPPGAKAWTKGYWSTVGMLSHVRNKEWSVALAIFHESFEIAGLPEGAKEVVRMSDRRKEEDRRSVRRKPIPRAHTLSVMFQALVPYLMETHGSNSKALIDNLYSSLIHNEVITIRRRSSSLNALKSSPLDPHTFIPFLQSFAADGREPVELFDIFNDMIQLGLQPSRSHWGVVLGAFARYGPVTDLNYILDILESVPSSAASFAPTRLVQSHLATLFDPINPDRLVKIRPDMVAYTSMIAGFSSRGEYLAARKVQIRMNVALSDRREGQDRRLVEVLQLLQRKERKNHIGGGGTGQSFEEEL